ncbi:MAG: 4Fe-4S binding protein [Chloroflexota bacterium]
MTTPIPNIWHDIPRQEIVWHPTVIAERCTGCGLCATSCGKNVYAFNYEANKPVVVAPHRPAWLDAPPARTYAPGTRSNSRRPATSAN